MNSTIHHTHCVSANNVVQNKIRKLVVVNIDRAKNATVKGTVQWFVIVIFCTISCAYHAKLRFAYFYTNPKAVDIFIEERNEGYLPALLLITFFTKEYGEFITNLSKTLQISKAIMCGPTVDHYVRFNGTDVKTLWKMLDTACIINDTSFTKNVSLTGAIKIDSLDSMFGTASKVSYTKPIVFGDSGVQLTASIDHPIPEEEICGFRTIAASTILTEKKNNFDDYIWLVNPEVRTQFAVALREYRILNETRNICISSREREKCMENCYITHFPDFNCRFPFDPRESLPFCNSSESTAFHLRATHKKISEIQPSNHCQCHTVCNNVIISVHANIDITGKPAIEMYVREKFVRIMVQRNAYTTISLLCDIGGILGLYLGLSCLSFTDIVTSFVTNWIKQTQSIHLLQDPLYTTVKGILQKERDKENELRNRGRENCIAKHTFRVIQLLSIVIWSYQTYNLLAYYFDYPLTVTIELKEDYFIQLPSVVTCADNPQIMFFKKQYAKNSGRNVTCLRHGLDLLDLLDPPSYFAGKSAELWEKSDTTRSKIFDEDSAIALKNIKILATKFGSQGPMATIYGNCTIITLSLQPYSKISSILWTAFMRTLTNEESSCDCHVKHFFIAPGELFDLKKSAYHPCDMTITVLYFVQTIMRINTPLSPCMPAEDARKCEDECFNARLKRRTSCKLPFMTSLSLPLCNDSISAKRTRELYFEANLKTNPLFDCHCQKRCRETIFLPAISYINEFPLFRATLVTYNVESNFREIVAQKLAFPVEKLLCDVGSNLGILLGMSLLSIFSAITRLCKYTGLYCCHKSKSHE